jgi:hypothetical protein
MNVMKFASNRIDHVRLEGEHADDVRFIEDIMLVQLQAEALL